MSSQYFSKTEHVLPCQHIRQYPRATLTSPEDVLHMCIKQYTPLDNKHPQPGDVTIIAAHANAVSKELYEPFWDELLKYSNETGHFRIRGIWIADVSFQGASGVLNEGKLGNDPSWSDHARDLLHMTNHFRDHMPQPIIGIGHSMGGHNMTDLALIHPRLLSSLILMDPVIAAVRAGGAAGLGSTARGPAYLSTFRRDIWPSRVAAAAQFRRNPFYQAWDPRVLDLWIEHGLRDLPTPIYPEYPSPAVSNAGTGALNSLLTAAIGSASAAPVPISAAPAEIPVTLTTTKHQEVMTFLRPNYPASRSVPDAPPKPSRRTHPDLPALDAIGSTSATPSALSPFYRPEPPATFRRLPHLRPHVLYLFAAQSAMSGLDPAAMQAKLDMTGIGAGGSGGVAEGVVTSVVIGGNAGHFVPFERPAECAREVGAWLKCEAERWREEAAAEEQEREELRRRVSERGGGVVVDEEWEFWMRTAGGAGGRKKGGSEEVSRGRIKAKI